MSKRCGWLSGAIVLLQVGAGIAAGADATPAPSTPAAQFAVVDAFFLTSYERAVREVLPDQPPAFLVLPDRLVLYRRGVRQEWPLIPPLFNELKTVAHVTLGLFAILNPSNGGPLGAGDMIALRQYQGLLASARSAIQQVGLSPEQRQRQDAILGLSQALAERALSQGHMPEADLTAFCRKIRP